MKDYTIEHSEFSDKVSIIETNDPAHADVINIPIKQLFGNTVANKKAVEDSKEQMESKLRAFKNEISESQAELNKSLEKSMNDIKESNAALGKSINNIADRITFIEKTQQLFDYKMYGKASYIFQRKDLLYALYEYTYLSMNDTDLLNEAFDYLLKNNKHIGEALSAVYGIDGKETLITLSTMTAIANSSTAMIAIANSSTAMTAIANSSTAMTAIANFSTAMTVIANSSTAMTVIANSSTAMTVIVNSSTAMTVIVNFSTAMTVIANSSTAMSSICKAKYNTIKAFIKVVNNSDDYIKKIFEVVTTNTDKFQIVANKYEDGVGNLNSHCDKPNTIILCALGHHNNSPSASVNLFINGEKVKTSNSAGSKPQNVTKSNCNAIAVPTATFTENSDAYAAIAVYKAI